jgi:hypothetical protein
MTIRFQPGSIDDDYNSTVESIFDFMDPRYDAGVETDTPHVIIEIADGLVGLQSFVQTVSA